MMFQKFCQIFAPIVEQWKCIASPLRFHNIHTTVRDSTTGQSTKRRKAKCLVSLPLVRGSRPPWALRRFCLRRRCGNPRWLLFWQYARLDRVRLVTEVTKPATSLAVVLVLDWRQQDSLFPSPHFRWLVLLRTSCACHVGCVCYCFVWSPLPILDASFGGNATAQWSWR